MSTAFDTAADILLGQHGHSYTPRGGAQAVFEATDPEVVVSGPAGTGKSRACLERLNRVALDNPGARFLIVRKTAASLGSTALVTWEEHVIADQLESAAIDFYGGSPREAPQYRYRNGSKVMIGGLGDAKAYHKVMSSEYDMIFAQEAIELTENDWEALTTRLRNGRVPHMQLVGDTNPDRPTHWLKARADRGSLRLIESRHEDNPTLYDDNSALTDHGTTYMDRLDQLTGVRHSRLRLGLWVAAEGIIYEDWDPAVHQVPHFDPPADWPRYWVVDFGFTNPFVCQWWAEDPDGRLWMYREIYMSQRLVEDHADKMLQLVTGPDPEWQPGDGQTEADRPTVWLEPKPTALICDHDAEGRAQLRKHLGLSTTPARKEVKNGIEATMARMRLAGDGKPRLVIMHDTLVERDPELVEAKLPTCTAEEIGGYIWAPSLEGKAAKEEPVKLHDHGCDAMRYLVADRDLRGRPQVRFFG